MSAYASEPSRLKQTVSAATSRIEGIIDAAEQVAEGIRSDAEREAERYLAERRSEADRLTEGQIRDLSSLTESLVGRANQIREQVDALVQEMERTIAAMAGSSPAGGRAVAQAGPEPIAYPGAEAGATGEAEDETSDGSLHEEALLRATQMAVAGKGRTEIETALRTELQIDDPTPVIDEILGSEAA